MLVEYMGGTEEPASKKYWAPQFETASRARIREIQEEKLRAMLPYLYDHSPFYREKFRAAKLRPEDIRQRRRPREVSRHHQERDGRRCGEKSAMG